MNNSFAALADSDDEKEVKKVNVKKTDKKEAPAAGKSATQPAPAVAATNGANKAKPEKKEGEKKDDRKPRTPRDGERRPRPEGDRPPRAEGERPPRGDRPPRRERPATTEGGPADAEEAAGKEELRGGKPGSRDRDHRKREPRDPNAPPPRKREHDRRSATGRDGSQRRGGRGPHAFGSEAEEAQLVEKGVPIEGETTETEAPETAEGSAEPVVEAAPEPQLPPQKTYEDLLKEREAARKSSELFGQPKVREVSNDFGKLQVAEKEEIKFVGGVAVPKKKEAKKDRKVKEVLTDVGFHHNANQGPSDGDRDFRPDSRQGRGGRGRGEGREGREGRGGRGGRGPAAGGRGRDHPRGPNFADDLSFPSL